MAASAEALIMLGRYPDSRPVICLKPAQFGFRLAGLPERWKFMVPCGLRCDAFKDSIRKHIKETVNVSVAPESIILTAGGTVLKVETMQDAYDQYKADDCFLYISFSVGSSGCAADGREVPSRPMGELPDCHRQSGRVSGSLWRRMAKEGMASEKDVRELMAKHPNTIPVICEKAGAPELRGSKYLVPDSMLCSEFRRHVLNRMPQTSLEKSRNTAADISFSVNNDALDGAASIKDVYERHKSLDGRLYLTYALSDNKIPQRSRPSSQTINVSIILPSGATVLENLTLNAEGPHTMQFLEEQVASRLKRPVSGFVSETGEQLEDPLVEALKDGATITALVKAFDFDLEHNHRYTISSGMVKHITSEIKVLPLLDDLDFAPEEAASGSKFLGKLETDIKNMIEGKCDPELALKGSPKGWKAIHVGLFREMLEGAEQVQYLERFHDDCHIIRATCEEHFIEASVHVQFHGH